MLAVRARGMAARDVIGRRPARAGEPTAPAWTWAVALGVLGVAALLRANVGCRAITFDEADYAWAASRGIGVNWLDHGDVNLSRHFHGPLLEYLLRVAVALGGYSETWVRVPGVVASAAAGALLAVAIADLASGSATRRLVLAATGGLLLATAPASITMSSLARPQPLVELLLVANVWLLCRHFRAPSARTAALYGVSLGLQFGVMEYGFVAVAATVAALALVALARPHGEAPGRPSARDLAVVVAGATGTVFAVWPPALLDLRGIKNLVYYLEYAERGQLVAFRGTFVQHVPWWAYAYWYWTDHPLLSAFIVGVVALVPLWMVADRGTTALVTGTFAIVTLAAVHGAHIMTMAYSCFAIPSLVMAGVLAIGWAWDAVAARAPAVRWTCRGAIVALVLAAIVDGPERPSRAAPCTRDSALARISRRLAAEAAPGDVVLASQWPVVRWVLVFERGRSDVAVEPLDPSSRREIARAFDDVRSGRYAWVVTSARWISRHPDAPLFRFVAESWHPVATDEGSVLYRNPAAITTAPTE